jgi:hypothetical protein
VWLASAPPITAVSIDQFMGHTDEAWIAVDVPWPDFDREFRPNEWEDESWPTRQWLVPTSVVNRFPRREVPLVEVLRIRLDPACPLHVPAADFEEVIRTEMKGQIQARWRAALREARKEEKCSRS